LGITSYLGHIRRAAFFVGVLAVLVLTAAAAGRATSTTRGRVTGLIQLCGGPAPSRCFSQNGTVSVLVRDVVVAKQKTQHSRFSFLLAPGNYTLVATTGGVQRQRTIVIKAHQLLHANIVIPVP
jgi:hypothetical protein